MLNESRETLLKCLGINDPGFSGNIKDEEDPIPINYDFLPNNFYNSKEVYANNSCGSKNAQRVSLQTGLLKVTHKLHTGEGSRLPFNLSLSYNQDFASRDYIWSELTPLPARGWKFNYAQSVKIVDDFAYYCDGEFNVHKLTKTGDKYFDKDGKTGLILTVNSNNIAIFGYQITDDKNTQLTFNSLGNLTKITVTSGSTSVNAQITYDEYGRLSKVTDGLGNEYTFGYGLTTTTVKDASQNTLCTLTIPGRYLNNIRAGSSNSEYTFIYAPSYLKITDNLTQTQTKITLDNNQKANYIVNYELETVDGSTTQTAFFSQALTYGNNRVVITHVGKNATEDEYQHVYYYFATNGDLIYISDKYEEAIENTTFVDINNFKESTVYSQLKEESGISSTIEEYEVTSLRLRNPEYTQVLGNNDVIYWNKTKDTTFDFIYNGSEISNVKFTLADYTKTILSKFKSPTCFNLWYNDGEDLITDCASVSICPNGSQSDFTDISNVKYATLTITDKSKSYSYISGVTSTQLTLSEYLYINDDYRTQTSVFNTKFQLLSETDYQNIKTTYTYDAYGDCTKTVTNKAGSTAVTTKLVNDYVYTNGKLSAEKGYYKLLRPTISYTYGVNDSISQITDPNGNPTTYGYLADGETFASITSSNIINAIEYEHGRIKKLTTNGTDRFAFTYNSRNELESVTPDPASNTNTVLAYNNVKKQEISPNAVITENIDDNYETRKYYDGFSRLRKITQVKKDNQEETELMYYFYWDDNGWTGIKQGDEQTEEDVIKNILSKSKQVDPFNSSIIASKQAKLRVVLDKTSSSDYNLYESYGSYGILYNGDKVERLIYPRSNIEYIVEERDAVDRVTKTKLIDEVLDPDYTEFVNKRVTIDNTIEYDSLFDNKISDEGLNISTRYDTYEYGEHIKHQTSATLQTEYSYDDINRLKGVTVSDGVNSRGTEYSFIPAQEQILVENDGPIGGMVGGLPTIPKPTYETVNIGTTNFIGEIKETGYGSSTITTQVEYDKNGNITKYGNNTYVYDSLNRLTRENNDDLNKTFVYTYNGVGNLFKRKEYGFTSGTISGDPINTRTFIYGEWNDQLVGYRDSTSDDLTPFTYDNAGRMTQKGTSQAFEWDDSGRLKKVSNITSTGVYNFENVYGSDGNRVARINYNANSNDEINSNKEHFRYINGKLVYQVHETNGSDPYAEIYYLYNSTGIIGFYYNNNLYNTEEYNFELYTYRKNLFGDITEIYKGADLVAKYVYDAWGNHKVCNPDDSENPNDSFIGNINPFRYRGYFYDTKMSLYYLKSRYYSPSIGRFISPDSVEYLDPESINGLNLYAYCMNNPVNYKQGPVSSGGSVPSSSISSISNGGIYSSGSVLLGIIGSSRVNWENGGFQIPIWISSLMSGSDFGASIAPALRTIYQYIRYPGVKDLNKLYGLDFVPGKLNTVCSVIGYGLLGINIGLSAWSNFTNDNLTTKQQWISFGVDTAYTLGTFRIGYGVGALVSLIPGVGVFIAPFVSAGVTWFIDWTNEKWGWLDDVKQWFNDL